MGRQKYMECEKCGSRGMYNKKHDSMFCKKCNIWLQDTCTIKDCLWCCTRPERPIDVNDIEIMFNNLMEEL